MRYKVKIRLRENLFQGNWLIDLECIATGVCDGQKRLVGIVTNLSRHLNSKGQTVRTALKYVALGSYKDFTLPMHSNLPRIWLPVTHPSEFLIFSTEDLGRPLILNGIDMVYATFVLKKSRLSEWMYNEMYECIKRASDSFIMSLYCIILHWINQ